jgi:hypothetical protein
MSRIGKGPWARTFAAALADDGAPELTVDALRIEPGLITAQVDGCAVTISAPTVPPRIWAAMTSYARNRGPLEQAVRGETQSVQLEHLMTQDWDEPLVPRASAVVRTCNCDTGGVCGHIAALARAVVEEIDSDPSTLLRWRGCFDAREPAADDPWTGGEPPELRATTGRRPLQSVLHRLGPSGIAHGAGDLVDALGPAYVALAAPREAAPIETEQTAGD